MKIILRDNVPKLGNAGDIVEAKRGYYRNFLEPRGLAVVATKGTLKKREEDREALERKAQKAHDAAVALGERITQLPPIEIPIKLVSPANSTAKSPTKKFPRNWKN